MKNILELLERAAARTPDKYAVRDADGDVAYALLAERAARIGSRLGGVCGSGKPVAVLMNKSVRTVEAMLGVVYAGCFYVVICGDTPAERVRKIFATLQPAAVLTDDALADEARAFGVPVVTYGEAVAAPVDRPFLDGVRSRQTENDPLYVLYTSGSTGTPKGAVLTHRNVLAYSAWAVRTFGFDESTVFGNQTPLTFSMSVTDVYSTLRAGATLVLIPKTYFTFPIRLTEFLDRYGVNTVYWVPSALCVAANLRLFDDAKPRFLRTVLFAGEVMPVKQLNYWRESLGDGVRFANLFGPTETTDICTWYEVDRPLAGDETVPIGRPCDNCDAFALTEDGRRAGPGEIGELYVRGPFVAAGYYNDPEKTAAAFVQNPLQRAYPETVYRTGDLVRENERGEWLYLGRRDNQIKHMGYRIELGEIEAAASAADGVQECCCLYEAAADRIALVYAACIGEAELRAFLADRLTDYMMPGRFLKLPALPHNQNGKIDRKALAELL